MGAWKSEDSRSCTKQAKLHVAHGCQQIALTQLKTVKRGATSAIGSLEHWLNQVRLIDSIIRKPQQQCLRHAVAAGYDPAALCWCRDEVCEPVSNLQIMSGYMRSALLHRLLLLFAGKEATATIGTHLVKDRANLVQRRLQGCCRLSIQDSLSGC